MKNNLIICYHSHPFHTKSPSNFPWVQIIGQTRACPLDVSLSFCLVLTFLSLAASGCASHLILKFGVQ